MYSLRHCRLYTEGPYYIYVVNYFLSMLYNVLYKANYTEYQSLLSNEDRFVHQGPVVSKAFSLNGGEVKFKNRSLLLHLVRNRNYEFNRINI